MHIWEIWQEEAAVADIAHKYKLATADSLLFPWQRKSLEVENTWLDISTNRIQDKMLDLKQDIVICKEKKNNSPKWKYYATTMIVTRLPWKWICFLLRKTG